MFILTGRESGFMTDDAYSALLRHRIKERDPIGQAVLRSGKEFLTFPQKVFCRDMFEPVGICQAAGIGGRKQRIRIRDRADDILCKALRALLEVCEELGKRAIYAEGPGRGRISLGVAEHIA